MQRFAKWTRAQQNAFTSGPTGRGLGRETSLAQFSEAVRGGPETLSCHFVAECRIHLVWLHSLSSARLDDKSSSENAIKPPGLVVQE